MLHTGGNDAKLKIRLSKSSPFEVKMLVDFIRRGISVVISFVVFYCAGLGGMIGITAQAGRVWTISAVILFFIAVILAFVQRAVTGI